MVKKQFYFMLFFLIVLSYSCDSTTNLDTEIVLFLGDSLNVSRYDPGSTVKNFRVYEEAQNGVFTTNKINRLTFRSNYAIATLKGETLLVIKYHTSNLVDDDIVITKKIPIVIISYDN